MYLAVKSGRQVRNRSQRFTGLRLGRSPRRARALFLFSKERSFRGIWLRVAAGSEMFERTKESEVPVRSCWSWGEAELSAGESREAAVYFHGTAGTAGELYEDHGGVKNEVNKYTDSSFIALRVKTRCWISGHFFFPVAGFFQVWWHVYTLGG